VTRRRWTFYLLSLLPVAALITLLAWGSARSGGHPGGLLVNGQPGEEAVAARAAPSFALEALDGREPVESASLRGKVVMLDFWSSWCPPCRAEAADLMEVYREYENAPVEFVGAAIWDAPGDVQAHLDRFNVTYPNGLDSRGKMAIDYGVRGIPEKYFLAVDGTVVRKYVGPISPDALRAILDELLAAAS
jgi:cytochrome c biogenesis protein CcmG/thiol:disulfide interchange protein DsbE